MEKPLTSKSAIAALILGILSFGALLFTSLPALFLGYSARAKIHRSNGALKGLGMAKAGIILGWIGTGMTILAILAAVSSFFFFVPNRVVASAKSSQAKLSCVSLRNAIVTFYTEYRKYPQTKIGSGSDSRGKSEGEVMNALLASGPGSISLNPKGIMFLSIPPGPSLIRDSAGSHTFLDPYGNPLHIIFDTNGDGMISDPFTGASVVDTVIIWSNGPDGKSATADDVKSW